MSDLHALAKRWDEVASIHEVNAAEWRKRSVPSRSFAAMVTERMASALAYRACAEDLRAALEGEAKR